MYLLFCVLFCFNYILCRGTFTKPQLVTEIPGYSGKVKETIYSGYIETGEKTNRFLFYTFVLANESPSEKPFLIWLNGGPGCASGLAFISEHGPYTLVDDGKVEAFPYSLNDFANVLYIDSPAGVGFSYNLNETDLKLHLNDDRTISDLYGFLGTFLSDVFPEYSKNELQIWGESYAGHYVPLFASYIQEKKIKGENNYHLTAIGVNNGLYHYEHNMNGDYIWRVAHSIVSYNQYSAAMEACEGNFWKHKEEAVCAKWISIFDEQMNGILNLDIMKDCYKGVNNTFPGEVIPCWDSESLDTFFNLQETYDAFHVNQKEWKQTTKKWKTCSDVIGQYYNAYLYMDVVSELKFLFDQNIRMLLMNGDVDDNCSNLSNQLTVNEVLGERIMDFPPWFYSYEDKPNELQVGGWYQKKGSLIFATVRGAGHMVSTYQPYRSYVLYKKFFENAFP